MLLTVDIGNTGITLGVFEGEELRATWQLSTGIHRTADEYAVFILNMIQQNLPDSGIDGVAICSVVPPLVATFEEMCQRYFRISPLVVEANDVEVRTILQRLGQRLQAVLVDNHPQICEFPQRLWKRGQLVTCEIDAQQASKLSHRIR